MCCTGKNRKRTLSPEAKFVSRSFSSPKKRLIPKELKFAAQKAVPVAAIPSGPVARPSVQWRPMPITVLVEYTGQKRTVITEGGYEFSKSNRIQAVDIADVGAVLKGRGFRRKT